MSNRTPIHITRQGEESHEYYAHALPISVEVMQLVADQVISRAEAVTLAVISALVKVGCHGCYASNAYLAKCCGVTPRQIQLEIAKLRGLKLVFDSDRQVILNDQEMRTIETPWSKAEGRRILRRGTKDSSCPPTKDSSPNTEVIDNNPPNPHRGECGGSDSVANAPSSSPHTGGCRSKSKLTLASIKIDVTPSVRFARRLRDILQSKKGKSFSYTESSWSRQFDLLRASLNGDEHLVDEVLDWYEKEWDWIIVKTYSAETFRKRFNTYLELKDNAAIKAKVTPGQGRTNGAKEAVCVKTTLSPEVVEQLDEVEWRRGRPDGLERFYSESLDSARRLAAISADLGDRTEEGSALDSFVYALGGSPKAMALRWVKWAAANANTWPSWGGSLKPYAMHPDGRFFRDRLNDHRGCCISGTVDRLLARLRKLWPEGG